MAEETTPRLRSQTSLVQNMTVRLPEVRRDEDASNFTTGFQFKAPRKSIAHPLPCQIASNQVMKWKRRSFSSHSLRCGKTKVTGREVTLSRSDFGSGCERRRICERKPGWCAKQALKTAKWQVCLKFIKALSLHEGPSEFVKEWWSLIVSMCWVRVSLILIDPQGFKMSSLVTQVLQRFECPARSTITNSTSGSSVAAKPMTLCQNPCQLPVAIRIALICSFGVQFVQNQYFGF